MTDRQIIHECPVCGMGIYEAVHTPGSKYPPDQLIPGALYENEICGHRFRA
jgi:hypothetical protein